MTAIYAIVAIVGAFLSGVGVGSYTVSRAVDRDEYGSVLWRSTMAAARLHSAYWAARDAIHREVNTAQDSHSLDEQDQQR